MVAEGLRPYLQNLARLEPAAGRFWNLQPDEAQIPVPAEWASVPRSTPDLERAVRRFISPVVVERLDAGLAGWLAEFRTLSMVYTRIGGLQATGSDGNDAVQGAIGLIHSTIAPLEAVVSEFIVGDKGVVAAVACGMPLRAQEDNAARAIEAARRLRSALVEVGLAPSIGVATGIAFCGDVGSATRRAYLMNGPVMHYAARLMQAARETILVDHETAMAARDRFRLQGPVQVAAKGRQQPLDAYQVLDAHEAKARPSRVKAIYGREPETLRLAQALDELARGSAAVLTLLAEPGAGKSRLLSWLHESTSARGLRAVKATASPFERTTAYFVAGSVAALLLLEPGDPVNPDGDLLRNRLMQALAGDPLEAKQALMEDVLPIEFRDKGLSSQIAGQARVAGIEDIFVRLCERAAARAPLVLAVDDVQWLDDPSATLLLAVSRRVNGALVALASRPLEPACGTHVRQLVEGSADRIELPRLDAASIAGIVGEVLGVQRVPPLLSEFVQRHAGGLPFHVEQLALALLDQGVVTVADGKCRVAPEDLRSAVVPGTLRDLIVSRVDKLDGTHQLVAKIASAIGREFGLDLLRAAYPPGNRPDTLETFVQRLVQAGILEAVPAAEAGTFDFRHAILREVTYGLMSFEQREPLHRRIAEFIEAKHAGELPQHYAELANHWEQAASFETAIHYREQAAMLAIDRYANHDALFHIACVRRLAAQAGLELGPEREARLARLQGDTCHELSRFDEAGTWFRTCAELSGIAVPRGRAATALSLGAELLRQSKHRFGAVPGAGDERRRARDALSAHLFTRLAEHAYFAGDELALVHATLTSLNRAERARSVRETVEGFGGLAIGLGTAGMHRLADFYRASAVSLAQREGGLHDQGFAHLLAAVYSFQAGKWVQSDTHCESGAAICERLGDRFRYQTCCVLQAYADLLRGRYAQAEQTFRRFGEAVEEIDNIPVRAWVLAGWSMLDMVRGLPPGSALQRLAAAQEQPLPRAEQVLCRGVEAAALLQAGQSERALAVAEQALDSMLEIVPTMGIALLSVSAVAEVHLALAAQAPQGGAAARRAAARSELASHAVERFAVKT
ncbi:MAG TPA: AAA family ATPase, partial [Burkholderiaceae bacterium]